MLLVCLDINIYIKLINRKSKLFSNAVDFKSSITIILLYTHTFSLRNIVKDYRFNRLFIYAKCITK